MTLQELLDALTVERFKPIPTLPQRVADEDDG